MAGITDGSFVKSFALEGIGAVSIGGYNIDPKTWNAAQKIASTGRKEFLIPLSTFSNYIQFQIDKIANNCPIFLNIRVRQSFLRILLRQHSPLTLR